MSSKPSETPHESTPQSAYSNLYIYSYSDSISKFRRLILSQSSSRFGRSGRGLSSRYQTNTKSGCKTTPPLDRKRSQHDCESPPNQSPKRSDDSAREPHRGQAPGHSTCSACRILRILCRVSIRGVQTGCYCLDGISCGRLHSFFMILFLDTPRCFANFSRPVGLNP
jgi:hypothetical protein